MVQFLRDYKSSKVLGSPRLHEEGLRATFNKEVETYLVSNGIARKVYKPREKSESEESSE